MSIVLVCQYFLKLKGASFILYNEEKQQILTLGKLELSWKQMFDIFP